MSERNRNRTLKKSSVNSFINYGIVIAAYIAIQAAIAGGVASNSIQSLLVPACCYIVMAVSLNLTVGILGELSLGHAGFMSLGAFSGIITATALQSAIPSAPLRLALAMVVGGVMGGIGGTIVGVPVLRLRGDYLAIVTLAFGEIIKNVIMSSTWGWTATACTSPPAARPGWAWLRMGSPSSRAPWARWASLSCPALPRDSS